MRMLLNRDSDLLAVATDDFLIRVFDINTRKVVRRFRGHTNQITDMVPDVYLSLLCACISMGGSVADFVFIIWCLWFLWQTFSPDGRWFLTACMDGSVRVFDVPSGKLIDWFSFDNPASSLCFSPKGDFFATTHTGNLGIFLWYVGWPNGGAGGDARRRSYFSHFNQLVFYLFIYLFK